MDQRALDYIRGELAAANRLGQLVAASVDLTKGRAVAVLPADHRRDIHEFASAIFTLPQGTRTPIPGGYLTPVPSTQSAVAQWVRALFDSNPGLVFVCESYLLRTDDLPRARLLPKRTFASGDFVYFWAAHDDAPDSIEHVVAMAYPVPMGFALIAALPADPAGLLASTVHDEEKLRLLVRGLQCLIVSAYDGESVLIWLPDGATVAAPPG